MLSFLKVKCPHCGAEGHIVAPPNGAIIVGECPKCAQMVVLFGGEALPLDKARMTPGSEEARRHLMDVIAQALGKDQAGFLRGGRRGTPEDVIAPRKRAAFPLRPAGT